MAMFVLIHSPLVGPATWSEVAADLQRRGFAVSVPTLRSDPTDPEPYWQQHARAVADAVAALAVSDQLILVGHSGGGVLLPVIRRTTHHPIAAYLFVDAGLPASGCSRLNRFEDVQAADDFRAAAVDGFLPTWSDEDLAEVIPDAEIRRRFVAELVPLPLAVYEEPLALDPDWPDAPCGYLRFGSNPAYDASAVQATRDGWAIRHLEGGHFHMLVDPPAVVDAMLDMLDELGVAYSSTD